MENRSLGKVFLLTLVTFGLYGIYWEVKTKGEMNARGATIPTAWLILVPFVNIWWMWKYCEGVEHVTGGGDALVLMPTGGGKSLCYQLPALLRDYLAGGGNPDAPGHFLAWLIARAPLRANRLTGPWLDIGSADDLAKAARALAN